MLNGNTELISSAHRLVLCGPKTDLEFCKDVPNLDWGRLKMQDWNSGMTDQKLRWAENAGQDYEGPNSTAGKRRTGK